MLDKMTEIIDSGTEAYAIRGWGDWEILEEGAASDIPNPHLDLSKGDLGAGGRHPGVCESCLSLWIPHLRNMTYYQL